MSERLTRSGLATAFANVGLATLYLAFAAAHLQSFRAHSRPSAIIVVVFEAIFAAFFVTRRDASATSHSIGAWSSTIVGSFLPVLMRPTGEATDVLAGELVQITGTALSLFGLVCLNRSLGLLPANRGVRSTGAYAIVRHPLYASYVVAQIGYLTSNLSSWNIGVMVVGVAAQLVRIRGEEQLLANDPEYVAYMARTRWRLVPFVY